MAALIRLTTSRLSSERSSDLSRSAAALGSCCDGDPLDANELQVSLGRLLHFKTQLNRFPNALCNFVQGSRLCMTAGDLGNRSDVVALFVAFNDDMESVRQMNPSLLILEVQPDQAMIIQLGVRVYRY